MCEVICSSVYELYDLLCLQKAREKPHSPKPNIVLILTDDQDSEMNSVSYMPKLQSNVISKGASFLNAYVNTPLCCPSRSSLLTGRYVHNHGVLNNSISGGCSSLEWQTGPEQNSIGVLLKNEGYVTHYIGKYLNTYGFGEVGGVAHVPPGWDHWIALLGNSEYYNYTLSVDGVGQWHGDIPEIDYLTNVIKNSTINFINQVSFDQPFFMMITPPAPHLPETPEPKYENSLSVVQIPRTPNFNIANMDKHWLAQYGNQPLSTETIAKLDENYRNRIRTLLSVDDMVEEVVSALEIRNLLNDTYMIYTSDHGYHLGQFSFSYSKREPYETDIRVPLFIRGPGIKEGMQVPEIAVNIDLTATFLDLAGASIPAYFDGVTLKNRLFSNATGTDPIVTRTILIEHDGEHLEQLLFGCESVGIGFYSCNENYECKCEDTTNNTFNCVRTLGPDVDDKYCLFNDQDEYEEYYNLILEPYEINNTVFSLTSGYHDYLTLLLNSMTSCTGNKCTKIN